MSQPTDLQGLEQSVYRARFEDGLVDLLFGMVALAWGLGLVLGLAYLGALVAGVGVALWPLLRQRISLPRTGYVEFSPIRLRREGHKALALVAVGLGLLALVALAWTRASGGSVRTLLDALGSGLGGFLLALPALLIAVATGVGRFGVYAAVFVGGGMLARLGVVSLEASVLAGGVIVLALAGAQLTRFMRTHPVRTAGEGGG